MNRELVKYLVANAYLELIAQQRASSALFVFARVPWPRPPRGPGTATTSG